MISEFKNLYAHDRVSITIIIVFYFIAFFFLPLNAGIFWDDWTVVGVNHQSINTEFLDYGIPQQGYLLSLATSLPGGIITCRILIFILFLAVALLLFEIIKSIKIIPSEARLFITLIFALFPVNFARISIATFPYIFCLFLFFFAWWLITRYLATKKIILRVLALFLFVWSFSLNSLLVFHLFVWLYLAYEHRTELKSLRSCVLVAIRYIDFILIPFIYWALQNILFPPRGFYQNYNQISYSNMLQLPQKFLIAVQTSLIEPIQQSLWHLSLLVVIVAIGIGIGYYFWKSKNPSELSSHISHRAILLLFGLLLFAVGVFPYLIVGHSPTLYEWTSRHQILIPLGASLIIYYLISLLFTLVRLSRWSGPLLLALCCSFVALNISTYFNFQKDWLKQKSIIAHFESSDVLRDSSTILFTDTTVSWNAIQRTYRFYEYTGLMRYVYRDETRLGENKNTLQSIDSYLEFTESDRYNMRSYQPHKPQYLVTIVPGTLPLNTAETLRLLYQSIVSPQQFRMRIPQIINFELQQMY